MCRLLGISYGENREELDTSEIAAIMFPQLVRQGPHAYGWMSYNEEKTGEEIEWKKYPGRSDTDSAWDNILGNVDPNAKWFVGHTRWATHGDPQDIRNNHPIPHKHVIGVHNGVVRNFRNILAITGREDPKTLVDSEAIFASVNKWGLTAGLNKLETDMVSIFADFRKPHLLYMARTSGRQITLGWTERGNIIFASDKFALDALAPEIQFEHFSTMSENRLLILKDGAIIRRTRFGKPKRKFTPPPAVVVLSRPHGGLSAPQYEWDEDDDDPRYHGLPIMSQRILRRASVLFPDGPPSEKHAQRTHNQNVKLYEFDGLLMTHAEYEKAIAEKQID